MTDHPQEHESLSAFIEKVEASGEDRKHAPLGYLSRQALALIENGHSISTLISAAVNDNDGVAIYTQQQLDDAVRAEKERIMAILKERHEKFVGLAAHFYERNMLEVATRDAAVASQLADIIGLLKDHP